MLRIVKARTVRSRLLEQPPSRAEDDLAALVSASRRGDAAALRTLLLALGPAMLKIVRKVLGARHPDVEVALQEATTALMQALPQSRDDCIATHFAYRVATFTSISIRRRHRPGAQARRDDEPGDQRDDQHDNEDPGARAATPDPNASNVVWGRAPERRALVRSLLDELPEPQAEALVLHSIVGLTVEEVAGTTGVPVETARSRLRLARMALRLRVAADPVVSELLEALS